MPFNIKLSLGDLADAQARTKAIADKLVARAAEDLAATTYNKIVELAQQRLHSTRDAYLQNLSYEPAGNGWTVTLKENALWIEDGMPRHEMVDDLLKNGTMAKDGSRYRVIPMNVVKGPSQTPMGAMPVRAAAMSALRKAKINIREIEREVDNRPKIGVLHKLDIIDKPIKTAEGAYQGWGRTGNVRQGPTGIPFLAGVRVIQRQISTQGGLIQRTALTFRVVSSKHKGTGRWVHPGIKPKKLMEEAWAWAQREWDTKIKQELLDALAEATQNR